MKGLLMLLAVLALTAANGQSTNSAPSNFERDLQFEAARLSGETLPALKFGKPSEITVGRLTYSGIAVQIFKLQKPLQLINPAAPPEFGAALDNALRDMTSNRVTGLKIFSISFW